MGMFSRSLNMAEHLNNISLRFYLVALREEIANYNYGLLKQLVDDFKGEIPQRNSDLRKYKNYCAFRECACEMLGSIPQSLDVFRKTIKGNAEEREKSLRFINSLLEKLAEKAVVA